MKQDNPRAESDGVPGVTGLATNVQAEPPARALDTGLACLVMMARIHAVTADADQLAHEFSPLGKPMATADILLAAKKLELKAKAVRVDAARLSKTPLPALAVGRDAEGGIEYFILARVDDGADGIKVLIQSPAVGRPETLSLTELEARWTGELILFTSRAAMAGGMAKFDFTWFIPAVIKYRKLLGEVLLVSLVLQLFALITPLFFQAVMDKVLVHRAFTTLDVIAVGLAVVMVFEVVLNALRSYIFAHTTSRIDVELGARLFRHLLALPMAYFQARRVGDSVARVRELENIRSFLTGNALTLLLDLLFSVVFISVMLHYSGWLTLIVVGSLPCYVIVSALFTPMLRARLHEKFNRGAENQAFLVETISGIDTVKAMAVEPHWTRTWDNQLAAYVSASFRTATIGTLANGGVSLISKLVTVATMYVGARLVIDNKLGRTTDRFQYAGRTSGPAGHAAGAIMDRFPADRDLGAAAWRHPQYPHRNDRQQNGIASAGRQDLA
jgi:subfamily B ATP-binding cassette protein HlyB/CyaB